MMTTKLLIAAFMSAGLASSPLSGQTRTYENLTHDVSTMQSETYAGLGRRQRNPAPMGHPERPSER